MINMNNQVHTYGERILDSEINKPILIRKTNKQKSKGEKKGEGGNPQNFGQKIDYLCVFILSKNWWASIWFVLVRVCFLN